MLCLLLKTPIAKFFFSVPINKHKKHVYFSYYFIEKVHLKKYTDILLLWIADKDALKVNSIFFSFLPPVVPIIT